jgi:hypothetical protein
MPGRVPAPMRENPNELCPYCHEKMDPGFFVATGRRVTWSLDTPAGAFWDPFLEGIELHTPIHSGHAYLPARRCPECKHIEFEY